MNRQSFIDMLMPAALEASQMTGIDPRIIVAQAAQETGWGRSAPGNNYFGIKSHGKGGGQSLATHEYVNGNRVGVTDSFRQYESPADSVMGYASFMTENPRYEPMRQARGMDAQLAALGSSGYATDPNYSSSVGSIARGIPLPDGFSAGGTDAHDLGVAPVFGGARNVGPYGSRATAGDPQSGMGPYGTEGGAYDPDPAIVDALSDKKSGGLGAALQALGQASRPAPAGRPMRLGGFSDARGSAPSLDDILADLAKGGGLGNTLLQRRMQGYI